MHFLRATLIILLRALNSALHVIFNQFIKVCSLLIDFYSVFSFPFSAEIFDCPGQIFEDSLLCHENWSLT